MINDSPPRGTRARIYSAYVQSTFVPSPVCFALLCVVHPGECFCFVVWEKDLCTHRNASCRVGFFACLWDRRTGRFRTNEVYNVLEIFLHYYGILPLVTTTLNYLEVTPIQKIHAWQSLDTNKWLFYILKDQYFFTVCTAKCFSNVEQVEQIQLVNNKGWEHKLRCRHYGLL